MNPAAAERLHLLIEECGEVIQAATKVLRHGYESHHPDDPRGPSNRQRLERELGDLMFAIGLCESSGDIRQAAVSYWGKDKARRVGQYLHHNEV